MQHKLLVLLVAGFILGSGCSYDKTEPEPLLAAPPNLTRPSYAVFDIQADNAVLSSMTVADIHFVPDRPKLNFLGRSRLTAIGHYLEEYGGKVVVDSSLSDEVVREERLSSVREFLLGQGLNSERLVIESGLTKGRGQPASEAVLFYDKNLLGEDSGSSAILSAGGEGE